MKHYTLASSICVKAIFALPFIQLLKVIMDWTFSITSLDLFQWFKLEDISYLLYVAKMDSDSRLSVHNNQIFLE